MVNWKTLNATFEQHLTLTNYINYFTYNVQIILVIMCWQHKILQEFVKLCRDKTRIDKIKNTNV